MKINRFDIEYEVIANVGYKLVVIDENEKQVIPLLLDEKQIQLFEKKILTTKINNEISFNLFVMIVSGCLSYILKHN